MLRHLSLHNFVLVTHLELDFASGFTVLTGETGAGKSILIDALQLVLGGRGDIYVIQEGKERTEISATFDASHPKVKQWLDESGIQENDEELLLRRTIDLQGKSRAWINGTPTTIGQLRELSAFLIDIHGQHAWQNLTNTNSAKELLDAYGQIDTSLLHPLWEDWQRAEKKLKIAQQEQVQSQTEHERLLWQINEVSTLEPQKDEWEELSSEHDRLSHAQLLMDSAQAANHALGDSQHCALDQIQASIHALDKAASIDPELANIISILKDAYALVDDCRHSLNNWLRHTDLEPDRLEELDTRMALWLNLSRRYHRKPEELFDLYQSWQSTLVDLEKNANLENLERDALNAKKAWYDHAQKISQQRKEVAPQLAHAITTAMQTLGMQGGKFDVAISALTTPQSSGLEQIEFLVAGHAGSTPKPVAKVASGGELSRLALAIAVVTSQHGYTSSLIFDEVDVGIGGAVAQTLGQLMRQLGLNKQVLAVTHLPQVAAHAHQQLVVSKQSDENGTTSRVLLVENEARIAEIARMLGGEGTSYTSLAHAKEMLKSAQC